MNLSEHLVDIARTAAAQTLARTKQGRVIAAFACARDARTFAGLKREAGEQVTVTAGDAFSEYPFEVRVLPRPLT